MKIAAFSVKNYQFTIVIFVLILALGVSSLLQMPKAEDPVLKATFNSIVVVYPGTSPEDMESLIVDPIEEKVASISDIKRIISTADDGVASIRIEFLHEVDAEEKYSEVLREVNALKAKLPTDIDSLDVFQYTPEGVSIIQCALMSEQASFQELKTQAERLKDQLKKVKNLKSVETWAYPEQQVAISLQLDKMAQLGIPVQQVMGAIQSENASIPAGFIEIGPRKLNIKTSGSYENLRQIEQTTIRGLDNQLIPLHAIAEIQRIEEQPAYLARLNGKRAVFLTATQKKNTNIFTINEQISPVIDEFQKSLPAHIAFEKSFDQAQSVSKRLLGLAKDFGIAIVLVLITLIPLGIRPAIIVMISIPLSLAIGLAGLDLLGFGINQLSVVGLVIALGLLVDDSIVVVENIARFIRQGYSRREASIEATKQIGLAVVGCTATLILAFLPLTFLPESSGDFIRSLPMAVIMTVLASLFVSITIVPFLSSLIMPKQEREEGNIVLQYMHKGIEGSYRKVLQWSLANPWRTLGIALVLFVGSLALIPVVGISVFPKSEKPQFLINIETPIGSNLATTNEAAFFVEKELARHAIVRNYATNVGKGNPRIYYNVIPPGGNLSNFAQLFVQLQEKTEVPARTAFIDTLRRQFSTYAGAKIKVIEFEQGPPVEAPLGTRIFGNNLDSLRQIALRVEKAYKETPGTIYVSNPMAAVNTDFRVQINREKAGLLGVPIVEIDRMVRLGISGLDMGQFKDEANEDIPIRVGIDLAQKPTLKTFDHLYVTSQTTGAQIPLAQLVTVEFETSPNKINHFDQERYTTVSSFIANGFLAPAVYSAFQEKLAQIKLPTGYYFQAAGEQERQKETFGGLGKIILITLFGILAVLILEFKTFKSSLIVLSVIPLGMIGAVGILYLTNNSLSFTAIVGIIALAGIEVKNSILLVDFTNYLRKEEKLSIDEAIEKAGETRFIPIVLTTLTAIGGLIPLVLEHSPLYSPLALVIIGGLISSLVLTRIVTPVLYKLLPPKVE